MTSRIQNKTLFTILGATAAIYVIFELLSYFGIFDPFFAMITRNVLATGIVGAALMSFRIERKTMFFILGALAIYLFVEILSYFGVISQFYNTIIRNGAVMAIVALGLNLIYGFNGQFSLGQFGFYAIGAYAAADVTFRWTVNGSADGLMVLLFATSLSGIAILGIRRVLAQVRRVHILSAFALYMLAVFLATLLGILLGVLVTPAMTGLLNILPAALSLQIVFLLAVLLAGVLAAEISFLFGLPVLTLGSDYFGIATLGFTIIVKVLLDNSDTILGFEEMKGARGMVGIPKITTWFWVFLFLFVIVIITRNLLHSSFGRAIVSVREDEIAARAMGIDVGHYKTLTFVLGSFYAGIGGGLYAHIIGFLHPTTFNFIKSFDPMIVIVFGGLGSVTGTLLASFTWAIGLEGVLRQILPPGFETWRFVIYPLLLLLLMLLRPKGLFGEYELPFLRQEIPPLSPTAAARIEQNLPPATITATFDQAAQPDAPMGTPGEPIPPREVTE